MYTGVILKAFLIFVTTLGLGLVGLFQSQGVVGFGDVTPVQYVIALIQAILAAVAVVQSQISDSPANVKQSNEIVTAAANLKQGGFARIWTLLVAAVAVTVFMVACSNLTPRKTVGAVSEGIEQLAIQVDKLQKTGRITNEKEDKFLDELKKINGDLRNVVFLTGDEKAASLEEINQRLIELEIQLKNEDK